MNKTFLTGHAAACRELAEALGIDPHSTRGFTLTVDAGQLVVLEIRTMVLSVDELTNVLKKFELKEKE